MPLRQCVPVCVPVLIFAALDARQRRTASLCVRHSGMTTIRASTVYSVMVNTRRNRQIDVLLAHSDCPLRSQKINRK
jgi:hypothetical protein